METDLKLFAEKQGFKTFLRGDTRIIVYLDNLSDLEKTLEFASQYSKVTLVSKFPIDKNLDSALKKESYKVGYKEIPKDRLIYEALGKGLKEYEYYITSFMFIKP